MLEAILTPLPVLCGINHSDYEEVLRITDEYERKMKTWVFLGPTFVPFNGTAEIEERSGSRIYWGSMD